MNPQETILTVTDLSKVYETPNNIVHALKKVSFVLYKGEILAIMGTSGSGKSTLLNILGAMDSPTSGEIQLGNTPYNEKRYKEPYATAYRRDFIGFIFQSFNLLKDLSVEENIALPLILKGEHDTEITKKVNQILDLVHLTEWRTHRPVELSGGQQQRVAIGRALISSLPIVLADEPTGNLDFNTSTDILNGLVEMKQTLNQSMVIVTHDAYVATFADRVLFFHDGKIVDEYKCQHNPSDMDEILQKFKYILEHRS